MPKSYVRMNEKKFMNLIIYYTYTHYARTSDIVYNIIDL